METSLPTRALVLCLVGLQAGPLCGQQDLLVNGSFESGPAPAYYGSLFLNGSTAITGWVVVGTDIQYCSHPFVFAADGLRSIDLNGNNPGGVEQSVTTVPGDFYTLQFRLAGTPQQGTQWVRVSAAGQWQDYSFNASSTSFQSMGWVERIFVFRAVASSTAVRFSSLSPGGFGPFIDHVRLYSTPYALYGPACAWSGGVPHLDASLPPRIGQPFGLILSGLPTNQPGAIIWGNSAAFWSGNPLPLSLAGIGMAGCSLFASPDLVLGLNSTGPFGATIWGDFIPNNPMLVGIQFYNQAFVLAPGANQLGVVTTNGGHGTVGN